MTYNQIRMEHWRALDYLKDYLKSFAEKVFGKNYFSRGIQDEKLISLEINDSQLIQLLDITEERLRIDLRRRN